MAISNIPACVKNKRLSIGLSQKEFGQILGLKDNSERTVGCWERGERTPTPAKLKLITTFPDIVPFRFSNKNPAFQFIDLFAGIGGIRLPFQEIGGKCVFSSEWDKFSQKTYAANFGELPKGDITKILSSDIPSHDLLLGGFPCQAFSQAGHRKGFYDTRGTMFFEIQRILAFHRPKAFLLENVKQLKGHDKGRTIKTIMSILGDTDSTSIPEDIPMSEEARSSLGKGLGYNVAFEVLRASNFGVPQNRERIYIIGFDPEQVPAAKQQNIAREILGSIKLHNKPTCLGDILEENINVPLKYTISDKLLAGHKRRLEKHRSKGNGFGFSLFTHESPYSNTLSARYYKDGSEILIDQSDIGKNPRKLTPRECARLQGFPEKFIIDAVSDVQNYRQFDNSVSVPVIRAIANEMKNYL